MATLRYRVIDTAGSELGFVTTEEGPVDEGDMVEVEVVGEVLVVEVYDDEAGTEGGVAATIVVDTD